METALTHEGDLYVWPVSVAALVKADVVNALVQELIWHLVTVNTCHTQVVSDGGCVTGPYTPWIPIVTQCKCQVWSVKLTIYTLLLMQINKHVKMGLQARLKTKICFEINWRKNQAE